MRLLLDEHFSPRIAVQLRDRGWDVVAARYLAAGRGRSDADVLDHAVRERRAVVTENVADYVALHRSMVVIGSHHFGLVFTSARRFPRTARAVGRLVGALDALLAERRADDALADQTWWLEPVRGR